ncbi:HNH endonuclease [Salipiger abyssi]|uniref:HNH endonuclease n=1 Tax=Salipiger abyssi TaxID=1250539 RepID=UPI004059960E
MGRLKGRGISSRIGVPGSRLRRAAPAGGETPARRSTDWLNTARWQKLRRKVLARDGYVCRQTGVLLIGTYPAGDSPVVDHIRPHRGDPALFWDEDNLQSVSKEWHDRVKQSREKRGLA